jgi:hypothetical protein
MRLPSRCSGFSFSDYAVSSPARQSGSALAEPYASGSIDDPSDGSLRAGSKRIFFRKETKPLFISAPRLNANTKKVDKGFLVHFFKKEPLPLPF